MPYKDPEKRREADREKKQRQRKQRKQKQAQKDHRESRTRNYATVVYPESAPTDWRERLSELHVAVLVSPLHDRDVNPDGEQKKPHYHVLIMFETVKSWEQVKPIIESIGGVGREIVNSSRGYARYLCHLDNPEKAQYSAEDVLVFGGADYAAIIHLPSEDAKMLKEVFAYIRVNQICSLAELIDICGIVNPDWFTMISMSRGYIVDKYIKSLNWEVQSSYVRKPIADPATGEMVGL